MGAATSGQPKNGLLAVFLRHYLSKFLAVDPQHILPSPINALLPLTAQVFFYGTPLAVIMPITSGNLRGDSCRRLRAPGGGTLLNKG